MPIEEDIPIETKHDLKLSNMHTFFDNEREHSQSTSIFTNMKTMKNSRKSNIFTELDRRANVILDNFQF